MVRADEVFSTPRKPQTSTDEVYEVRTGLLYCLNQVTGRGPSLLRAGDRSGLVTWNFGRLPRVQLPGALEPDPEFGGG